MGARARRSQGSSMIAQRTLDRQRAGEISARATKSPNWQRRKSDAFEYAETLDTEAEQQAGAVREAGEQLKQQLRVDIPSRGGSGSSGPSSPAQRIKQSRAGPRNDLQAATAFDVARVEELWEFNGDFIKSQFEGE